MEGVTEDILTSVLSDEFKIAVEKKDKIIAALDKQIGLSQDKVAFLTKEVDDLSKKKAGLSDEIIMAYADKDEALKNDKVNFEESKANSTASLEAREKDLDNKGQKHDETVKALLQDVNDFKREVDSYKNKKKAIIETLTEAFHTHCELLTDVINALQEEEPVKPVPEEPKGVPVEKVLADTEETQKVD